MPKTSGLGPCRICGAHKINKVCLLCLVELESSGDTFQHALGDPARVPAFEPGVVLDADAREQRDLFAAEPRHAPLASVGR